MLEIISKRLGLTNCATGGRARGLQKSYWVPTHICTRGRTCIRDTPYTRIKRDSVQYDGLNLYIYALQLCAYFINTLEWMKRDLVQRNTLREGGWVRKKSYTHGSKGIAHRLRPTLDLKWTWFVKICYNREGSGMQKNYTNRSEVLPYGLRRFKIDSVQPSSANAVMITINTVASLFFYYNRLRLESLAFV